VSGIPAALGASLMWGTADFLAGQASRRHPVVLVAMVGQAAGLFVLAVVIAFHGADAAALAPGAVAGAFGIVGVVSFYRALALGTMSIVAPITATCAIVPVAVGIFDGDRPGALQCTGMLAALIGVILASREPGAGAGVDPKMALRLAFLAALAIGVSLVALDRAADHDALTGVFAARAVSTPVLAAAALRLGTRAPRRALPGFAGIGLIDTGANVAFSIATTGGLLSLVAVLGGLFPVVTVALAYLLLHERLLPLQRAGVVLALAGVPLMSV
jgi:drug/metabolite transporter (DMT)-like permease